MDLPNSQFFTHLSSGNCSLRTMEALYKSSSDTLGEALLYLPPEADITMRQHFLVGLGHFIRTLDTCVGAALVARAKPIEEPAWVASVRTVVDQNDIDKLNDLKRILPLNSRSPSQGSDWWQIDRKPLAAFPVAKYDDHQKFLMRAREKVEESIRDCDMQIERLQMHAKDAESSAIEIDSLQAQFLIWLAEFKRSIVQDE